MINVKDAQFGAVGNGTANDTNAIQNAVNYAKSLSAPGGGIYRTTIYFPAGYYYISSPINVTNANGIWLMGDGGSYINTGIIGNTGGAIFDFSGSSSSGCENFFFLSGTGYGATRSTIGAQFALTNNGGLNCGIRNCSFQMEDFPTANNGAGTIGVLNVRSEEFYVHQCLIRANVPLMFSYAAAISIGSINFTASSNYQALASGTGSMGVVSIQATSLQNYEKRQPALVLNGTNSVNFQGYISRLTANTGSNETAILCNLYTTNLFIHATIESFSQVLKALSGGFENNEIKVAIANSTAPTTPLIDVTGCVVLNIKVQISLPNTAERANRYALYHEVPANPNQLTAGSVINGEIMCHDVSNEFVISPGLLRKSSNISLNTRVPFEKKGGRIRQLISNYVNAGTVGDNGDAVALRFTQADNPASPNGRGGYYRIWIEGVIQGGSYGSGSSAALSFQAQIMINQSYQGNMDLPSSTVIVLDRSVSSPNFVNINGAVVSVTFANRVGTVLVSPKASGSFVNEPLYYSGVAEIQSNFLVFDPIILQ
ncbi:hypothetical protein GCM10028807_05530 [Spirosoma daeguense]